MEDTREEQTWKTPEMNRQTRKRQTRNHTTETYRQNKRVTGRETDKTPEMNRDRQEES